MFSIVFPLIILFEVWNLFLNLIQGQNGSQRAQSVFNDVSKLIYYISHAYHMVSDMIVIFSRSRPRYFESYSRLLQDTTHLGTNSTEPPSSPTAQQFTSTQTTTDNQYTSVDHVLSPNGMFHFFKFYYRIWYLIKNLFIFESRRSRKWNS